MVTDIGKGCLLGRRWWHQSIVSYLRAVQPRFREQDLQQGVRFPVRIAWAIRFIGGVIKLNLDDSLHCRGIYLSLFTDIMHVHTFGSAICDWMDDLVDRRWYQRSCLVITPRVGFHQATLISPISRLKFAWNKFIWNDSNDSRHSVNTLYRWCWGCRIRFLCVWLPNRTKREHDASCSFPSSHARAYPLPRNVCQGSTVALSPFPVKRVTLLDRICHSSYTIDNRYVWFLPAKLSDFT